MKKVVLDRALYRMNAVKQAAEAFSELASIEVKPSGKDKIAVKIQPTDEETAAVVVDAVVRLLPGVLGGGEEAVRSESFSEGLLEAPQYTRPPVYRGMAVPTVLQSGNHGEMEAWCGRQALDRTARRRPDLLQ